MTAANPIEIDLTDDVPRVGPTVSRSLASRSRVDIDLTGDSPVISRRLVSKRIETSPMESIPDADTQAFDISETRYPVDMDLAGELSDDEDDGDISQINNALTTNDFPDLAEELSDDDGGEEIFQNNNAPTTTVLPEPSLNTEAIESKLKALYETLMAAIKSDKLRDNLITFLADNSVKSPDIDQTHDKVFIRFKARESVLSGGVPDEIVKPSGSLKFRLAGAFHYPTRITKCLLNGEVADESNPSMRLIIRKGFNSDNMFFFDWFPRRMCPSSRDERNMRKSQPYDEWNEELLRQHKHYRDWIFRNVESKVLVVVGAANRFSFFDEYSKNLVSVIDSIYIQTTEKGGILRVVIFVDHPEYFYHVASTAEENDLLWNFAAYLVGLPLESLDTSYFNRFASHREASGSSRDTGRSSGTMRDCKMVIALERQSGTNYSWDTLSSRLQNSIRKAYNIGDTDDETEIRLIMKIPDYMSLAYAMMSLWSSKGIAKQKDDGYQNLIKGRAAQKANGHAALKLAKRQGKLRVHFMRGPKGKDPKSVPLKCLKSNAKAGTDHNPKYHKKSGRYCAHNNQKQVRVCGCTAKRACLYIPRDKRLKWMRDRDINVDESEGEGEDEDEEEEEVDEDEEEEEEEEVDEDLSMD